MVTRSKYSVSSRVHGGLAVGDTYIYVLIRICIYVYIHIHTHIFVYICMYICMSTVEIFDPSRGAWTRGPNMVSHRAFHGGLAVGGSIYVVGGFDGIRDLDLVDRLDVARGTWIRGRCVCV